MHHNCSRKGCLVFALVQDHSPDAMRRSPVRQLLVLILAVLVTAGMGLSAVEASQMTVKMAIAADMGMAGHDGCPGCPDGNGNNGMKAMPCAALCAAPLLAVLPQAEPIGLITMASADPLVMPVLHGRVPTSDPVPPRTTDIG